MRSVREVTRGQLAGDEPIFQPDFANESPAAHLRVPGPLLSMHSPYSAERLMPTFSHNTSGSSHSFTSGTVPPRTALNHQSDAGCRRDAGELRRSALGRTPTHRIKHESVLTRPSVGHWERTVNPSASPSKVRILHPPRRRERPGQRYIHDLGVLLCGVGLAVRGEAGAGWGLQGLGAAGRVWFRGRSRGSKPHSMQGLPSGRDRLRTKPRRVRRVVWFRAAGAVECVCVHGSH